MDYKKIFVPGGTGFLGRRVIKKLKERGMDYVSSSLSGGNDFRDPEDTLSIFRKERFDAVINCAAYVGGIQYGYEKPAELFYNNTLMSTYLMDSACKTGVKRFVNPISNCSYPSGLTRNFNESEWWDGPLHESVLVYGFVRKASWVQAWAYYHQYGFQTVNLILPNMYGPGDHFDVKRSHALGAMIKKFVDAKRGNKESVEIWGSGTPVREWLYIDDGAEALIRALEIDYTIEPINIGVGKGISILELSEKIKNAAGFEGDIILDETKPDGAPYKTMDNGRMKGIFGWTPQTRLDEGIRKTVEWYMDNNRETDNES